MRKEALFHPAANLIILFVDKVSIMLAFPVEGAKDARNRRVNEFSVRDCCRGFIAQIGNGALNIGFRCLRIHLEFLRVQPKRVEQF